MGLSEQISESDSKRIGERDVRFPLELYFPIPRILALEHPSQLDGESFGVSAIKGGAASAEP